MFHKRHCRCCPMRRSLSNRTDVAWTYNCSQPTYSINSPLHKESILIVHSYINKYNIYVYIYISIFFSFFQTGWSHMLYARSAWGTSNGVANCMDVQSCTALHAQGLQNILSCWGANGVSNDVARTSTFYTVSDVAMTTIFNMQTTSWYKRHVFMMGKCRL